MTTSAPRFAAGGSVGLATAFAARACASFVLSGYLLSHELSWTELFRSGALYALIDGVIGLASVVPLAGPLRSRTSPALIALSLGDALFRVFVGIFVLRYPAVAQLPMLIVPLFGSTGVVAAALGLAALIIWLVEHHRHRNEPLRGSNALFDPIPVIAALSIAVGTMLFFDPPTSEEQLWRIIAVGGTILGLSFMVAALGAFMSRLRAS